MKIGKYYNFINWMGIFLSLVAFTRIFASTSIFIPNANTDICFLAISLLIGVSTQIFLHKVIYRIRDHSDLHRIYYNMPDLYKKFSNPKSVRQILCEKDVLFSALLTCIILYSGAFLLLGNIYTDLAGHPFEDNILVPDNEDRRSEICAFQYKVGSSQFTGLLGFRALCIDKDTHEKLPKNMGALKVRGKISNWGHNIDDYEIIDDPELVKSLYSQQETLINKWRE